MSCLVLWFALGIIRATTIFTLFPVMNRMGYGLRWKEAGVMVWGDSHPFHNCLLTPEL